MITPWLARHPILGFLAFSHGWTFGWIKELVCVAEHAIMTMQGLIALARYH